MKKEIITITIENDEICATETYEFYVDDIASVIFYTNGFVEVVIAGAPLQRFDFSVNVSQFVNLMDKCKTLFPEIKDSRNESILFVNFVVSKVRKDFDDRDNVNFILFTGGFKGAEPYVKQLTVPVDIADEVQRLI